MTITKSSTGGRGKPHDFNVGLESAWQIHPELPVVNLSIETEDWRQIGRLSAQEARVLGTRLIDAATKAERLIGGAE